MQALSPTHLPTALLTASNQLPVSFRIVLLIFMLLMIGAAGFLLFRNRRLYRNLSSAMINSREQIQELDRCQIDNLPTIAEALTDSGNEQLADAGQRMTDDSDRLFQGKWLPTPESYFAADSLLTSNQSVQLSFEPALQLLALGVVGSAVSLLVALNFMAGARTNGLQYGLLPALLGIVAATLLAVQTVRIKRALDTEAATLGRSIRRRVPVFEELSGTAALIESFVRYDRDMSASVETLTETINDLSKNKLVELISQNLQATLRQELAPPLRDSQQSLGLLARELTQYQATGVQQMAEAFIAELSDGLSVHLKDILDRMDTLTDRLEGHYRELIEAQTLITDSRAQSAAIQEEIAESLEQLQGSRDRWQDDIAESRRIQQDLNSTLAEVQRLQSGEAAGLNDSVVKVSQQLQRYHEDFRRVESKLAKLNQETGEAVETFSVSSSESLKQIRELVAAIEEQAEGLSSTQTQSNEQLAALSDSLGVAVQHFNSQLQSGVSETLTQFDDGLTEISERLSGTTADLRDTADRLSQAKRKQEHESRD